MTDTDDVGVQTGAGPHAGLIWLVDHLETTLKYLVEDRDGLEIVPRDLRERARAAYADGMAEEFNRLREEGHGLRDAVRLGTLDRLRPVVMTALMAALGLLPAALSHGIGAETTRPFASVIVGGLLTSTVLTLLLLPILYLMFHDDPHEEIPR